MVDVSPALVSAAQRLRDRLSDESSALTRRLASALTAVVSWDPGNEDWATLLSASGDTVAQIHMRSPLVMTVAVYAQRIRDALDDDSSLIVTPDWDAPALSASAQSLTSVFGSAWNRVGEPRLDSAAFSASELWFYTV